MLIRVSARVCGDSINVDAVVEEIGVLSGVRDQFAIKALELVISR